MKMNDEKFIVMLQRISLYCKNHDCYDGCIFANGTKTCNIVKLIAELDTLPFVWDIERIKEIINE